MRTFDLDFKMKVVRAYLARKGGYKLLGKRFGISESMVRRWVGAYEHHGRAGLVRQRGIYTPELKLEVLHRAAAENLSYLELASIYNIANPNSITTWHQQQAQGKLGSVTNAIPPRFQDVLVPSKKTAPSQSPGATVPDDTAYLLSENERLRAEVAYLKKFQCLGSCEEIGAAEKAKIVHELRHEFCLAPLLRAAELARSTFYYQLNVAKSPDRNHDLKEKIQSVYFAHRGLYGYRRVTLAIRNDGEAVNHKKVQRLMNELAMKSRIRKKRYRSYKGEYGKAAPNVLNRDFTATRPNEKWVTDVTEFSVGGKKLYLSPVLDLYNGEIVAYESSIRPDFSMVMEMLKKTVKARGKTAKPLLHSDQGWHYRMPLYQAELARRGITQSMSRKGNCFDNAVMESFFGTLKAEYFHLNEFADINALRAGLKEYIDYYNRQRIKSKLGGLSPVGYRMRAGAC
ncbi:IS3 family transposase [Robbsia andropogonis]|uniref:IS3 family transposase n=1 Tax=Robbsia andropogonis TaxID=28092 RepID=UPI003D1EDCA2